MNTWVDSMIANLELKQAELERQLAGIRNAVLSLKQGYEHPEIPLPQAFRPDTAPSVKLTQDAVPETEPAEGWPA